MEITNEQIVSLAKFALGVLDDFPEAGSIDMFDIQELAIKHNILVGQTVHCPCQEEGCYCAEYYSEKELLEGVTCYRFADWLTRATELRNEAVGAGADESRMIYSCPKCGKPRSRYDDLVQECLHCGDATILLGKQ